MQAIDRRPSLRVKQRWRLHVADSHHLKSTAGRHSLRVKQHWRLHVVDEDMPHDHCLVIFVDDVLDVFNVFTHTDRGKGCVYETGAFDGG